MPSRFFLPALVVLFLFATTLSSTTARAATATTISGGGLPHAVTLAAVDQADFVERINLPPLLDDAPAATGVSYTVVSDYWDVAVRNGREGRPVVETSATYYPDGGFVRTRQGTQDRWIVIDLRQRAILDRYILLVQRNQLDENPGVFDVVRAAAAAGEPISVQVGDAPLTVSQLDAFWRNAASARRFDRPPSAERLEAAPSSSVWLVFGMPEGRSLDLLYNFISGVVVDSTNSETWSVSARWLEPVLGPNAPVNGGAGESLVQQDEGAGSPIWWPIMFAIGLSGLGAAWWLSKRIGYKTG